MSVKDKNSWKRKVPTRIYDYNYKVGESYYNPQTEFIENRELLSTRKAPPPEAQTYAERFANRPFYGTAHGLPYDGSESVRLKPSPRRSVSAGRSRFSRDREADDVPSSTRSSRGRDRKLSFNVDDFGQDVKKAFKDFAMDDDADFKPKAKHTFSLDDDSDFRIPRSRRSSLVDNDRNIADEFTIRPENKTELMKKFKDIEREFQKADALDRGSSSRKYEHNAWNDELNIPGKKSVKRDEFSYTDPTTGAKVHKTSFQESSKFASSSSTSSKPPIGRPPRPSRLLSVDDELDHKPIRSMARRISMSDIDNDLDIKSLSLKAMSHIRGDDEKKFRAPRELRDLRKAKESEELSVNINKMISKMKRHAEDGPDEIRVSRTFRSSSLDPYQKETFTKASPRSRFVYGVSRI